MVKKATDDTDIDDVKLTFGSIGKIIALMVTVVTCVAAFFNLQARQDSFERLQTQQNEVINKRLEDLTQDAKFTKTVIQDMQMTLQRTNIILEKMEKKQ